MTETIKELICICCPKGCHLRVDTANDYAVTGNACPNGAAYGKEELTHPTRIITSTVRITGGLYPRCPVKTAQAVPKEKMFSVMAALNTAALQAPVHTGDVVLPNGCGTGSPYRHLELCGIALAPLPINREVEDEQICSCAGSGYHQQPGNPV